MNDIELLDKRITNLEKLREKDRENVQKNNIDLALILQELKNITKSMESLSKNWEEAVKKSEEKSHEEYVDLLKRVEQLEKKHTQDKENLENLIDERTVEKDSKEYNEIRMKIILAIITAILGFVLGLILK